MSEPMTVSQMCDVVDEAQAALIALRHERDSARQEARDFHAALNALQRWQIEAAELLDEIAEHFDGKADPMKFKIACDALTARVP